MDKSDDVAALFERLGDEIVSAVLEFNPGLDLSR